MPNAEYPKSFVAIDFETMSGKRLFVCQVGMVKYLDGQPVDTFVSLVCPPPGAPTRYKRVHDITPDMVQNSPTFADLLSKIEAFVGQLPLVAHNGLSVERACIRENLAHYGLSTSLCYESMLDTLKIAKAALPDVSHELTALCQHYGICDDNHHDAAADARMCGELYLRLIDEPGADLSLHPQPKALRRAPTHYASEKKYRAEDMAVKADLSLYADNPFRGKYVCLTGFSHDDCEYFGAKLSKMGATMRTAVSGKVNILVLGDTPGPSKISKAEELGLRIMEKYEMEEAISHYKFYNSSNDECLGDTEDEDEELPLKDKIIGISLLVAIGSATFYGLTHCFF